jgi:CDP-glucose 4,6-dehydratase
VAVTPAFWKGRPVLVTGHTGFKGSWLGWWLVRLGAKVAGFALEPPTSPSLYEQTRLAQALDSTTGDVRDADALLTAFHKYRPEIVFHLAAQSLVRESYRLPAETFATNVSGTVHCLEAARRCPSVRALIVVTTDKCYRNAGTSSAYREGDALGGDDPYSASKACAEVVTHAYRNSFFDARQDAALIASVRAGNAIGGGDWAAERLIPDAMRAFMAARPLRIRYPDATRPWQHVLEPLHGYLLLAERLGSGDRAAATAWNFGPNPAEVSPVSRVADGLARRWGGVGWERDTGEQPHEAALLSLDSAKARSQLGWRPVLALDKALDWVVEWYRLLAQGGDVRALTLEQIGRYQAAATA